MKTKETKHREIFNGLTLGNVIILIASIYLTGISTWFQSVVGLSVIVSIISLLYGFYLLWIRISTKEKREYSTFLTNPIISFLALLVWVAQFAMLLLIILLISNGTGPMN